MLNEGAGDLLMDCPDAMAVRAIKPDSEPIILDLFMVSVGGVVWMIWKTRGLLVAVRVQRELATRP